MSKSRGNVISPDDLVNTYGTDTVRVYLMFGWRWEMGGPWDSRGIEGSYRFLNRVWEILLFPVVKAGAPTDKQKEILQRKLHQTIKRATQDLKDFAFNTYIASLMEFSNLLSKVKPDLWATDCWREAAKNFTLLLAPAAPHLAEELWSRLGEDYSVHDQQWPKWDEALVHEEEVEIVIQVNGKIRERLVIPVDASEELVKEKALALATIETALGGKVPRKTIYVPGRLLNIVV